MSKEKEKMRSKILALLEKGTPTDKIVAKVPGSTRRRHRIGQPAENRSRSARG